jgi:hypothetical protein
MVNLHKNIYEKDKIGTVVLTFVLLAVRGKATFLDPFLG